MATVEFFAQADEGTDRLGSVDATRPGRGKGPIGSESERISLLSKGRFLSRVQTAPQAGAGDLVDLDFVDWMAYGKRFRAMSRGGEQSSEPPVSWCVLAKWSVFGASGWFASNCILAEMPIFIAKLPAHESLGSQVSMMIQCGSFVLFAYKLLEARVRFSIVTVLHVMMATALVSLFAAGLFWDALMFGWNLPLLAITVLGGSIGCMSSVTHWVFAMAAPPQCSVAVSFGMSMGGIITNALAAFQMLGRDPSNPRISVRVYFAIAACLQAIWWVVVVQVSRQRGGSSGNQPAQKPLLPTRVQMAPAKGNQSNAVLPPPAPPAAQRHATLSLGLSNFLIHGAMYVLPSLLPFDAGIFPDPTSRSEVMLWMGCAVQFGDSTGRLAQPTGARRAALLLFGLPAMLAIFVSLCALVAWPELLALLSPRASGALLPGLVYAFCFCYGALQSTLFLKAREMAGSIEGAERAASMIGTFGQLGSVTTNLASFLVLNFRRPA